MPRAWTKIKKRSAVVTPRLEYDLMITMRAMAATMALPARLKLANTARVTALDRRRTP